MIRATSIGKVKKGQYDEVWAIVRSMKSPSPWIKQVQELSPSKDLFFKYREMAANKTWNADTFMNTYVPQFLREMHEKSARDMLNKAYLLDKAGKNLALVCFCTDESLCHRSIIAGLLQAVGCNVQTDDDDDYSYYYDMYKKYSEKEK